MTDNPFAVLTAIVAPAILTNACTVLALGTSNRIARVVDRTRVIVNELPHLQPDDPEYQSRIRQLERLRDRAQLLMKALRIIYAGLGSFAASALISVIGSAMAFLGEELVFKSLAVIGLAVGVFATLALVTGCIYMVRETRLALQNIAEEAALARNRFAAGKEPARYL